MMKLVAAPTIAKIGPNVIVADVITSTSATQFTVTAAAENAFMLRVFIRAKLDNLVVWWSWVVVDDGLFIQKNGSVVSSQMSVTVCLHVLVYKYGGSA